MKNKIQFMKSRVLALAIGTVGLFFVIVLTLPSCNSSKPEDTKDVAEEQNDAKFESAKEDDAKFLVSAAEINMDEIQLGQMAQERGTSSHVKELGKMMETEHSKALDDLKVLAAKKLITIPATLTDEGMNANKKLMDTKASDFDKEYADMMVSGHKDAISKFEKASTDATDTDIRNWASSMIPVLRMHLEKSITCQKQCEKM